MRKHQQKQLFELTKTLDKANTAIERALSIPTEREKLSALFVNCQDLVVNIGNHIDSIEGKGTKASSLLQEYCEILYRLSQELNHSNLKTLKKQLVSINNSIYNELKPNKIEAVFLPYKAAMSDSLESVWQAALADPDCDAYIIPIPYYELNSDGTFGQMHYEGDLYPDNVPITNWQEYDIEKRHPDIIFIHNPYDEGNRITSLHPNFYSSRLKTFTDLLVYVPYFVCLDDVFAGLCVNSGTVYADKVIVQSEKIRQTYIRLFKEFEEENNCKNRFGKPEDKIVALGSPKYDKVLKTKRENCAIPGEWRRLIEKQDGTDKKVILYNTTLTAFLRGNEQYLKKIRSVLELFQKRDDVVLWWRPHPLNDATCQSMRPKLLFEYEQLIAEYKREGYGIYDDTPDLHRAIAWGDAYYGDWSSVMPLYLCTGKPIMLQNISVWKQNDHLLNLRFENLYDDGAYLWFTSFDFNALFRTNKETWRTEYMGSFPDEKTDGRRLYTNIVSCAGKLYFTPYTASEIAEYDLQTNTFRKIAIPAPQDSDVVKSPNGKFFTAIQYGRYIFFIGHTYPGFIKYDTVSGCIDCCLDWVVPLNRLVSHPEDGYFARQAAYTEGDSYLTLAACNANAVVRFNMDTCTSEIFEVGGQESRYGSICFDGMDYWLLHRHECAVLRWRPGQKGYEEYREFPKGYAGEKYNFWDIAYAGGYVWLFPNQAAATFKINVQNGQIDMADDVLQPESRSAISTGKIPPSNYILARAAGDIIYAHNGKYLTEYNWRTGQQQSAYITMPPENERYWQELSSALFQKDAAACIIPEDCLFRENVKLSLPAYISYAFRRGKTAEALAARQSELRSKMTVNADGQAGNEIFRYCQRLLT